MTQFHETEDRDPKRHRELMRAEAERQREERTAGGRFALVDRLAERIFERAVLRIEQREGAMFEDQCRLCAERAFDAANVFWDERYRRRGEFEAAKLDPLDFESHAFAPAQGNPDFCLDCGKRRELHR